MISSKLSSDIVNAYDTNNGLQICIPGARSFFLPDLVDTSFSKLNLTHLYIQLPPDQVNTLKILLKTNSRHGIEIKLPGLSYLIAYSMKNEIQVDAIDISSEDTNKLIHFFNNPLVRTEKNKQAYLETMEEHLNQWTERIKCAHNTPNKRYMILTQSAHYNAMAEKIGIEKIEL